MHVTCYMHNHMYPEVVEGEVEVGEGPGQWGQVRRLREEVGLEAQPAASVHHAVHYGRLGRRYQRLVARVYS